jgi:hypothetical protein
MNAFTNLLSSPPALIVSLPSNSLDLAKAAMAGGADALKVHIHIHHDASGTHFGTLAQEHAVLEQILALGLPTGIVIGADQEMATPEEMTEIAKMGFQAFDAYAHFLPAWMMSLSGMAKMLAVGDDWSLTYARTLETLGMNILEAAIVPHTGYGQPLMTDDLIAYRSLRQAVSVPIVVPTQRAVTVEDLPLLFTTCRVHALMIGAIVTGKEGEGIEKATANYKIAMTALVNR